MYFKELIDCPIKEQACISHFSHEYEWDNPCSPSHTVAGRMIMHPDQKNIDWLTGGGALFANLIPPGLGSQQEFFVGKFTPILPEGIGHPKTPYIKYSLKEGVQIFVGAGDESPVINIRYLDEVSYVYLD